MSSVFVEVGVNVFVLVISSPQAWQASKLSEVHILDSITVQALIQDGFAEPFFSTMREVPHVDNGFDRVLSQ